MTDRPTAADIEAARQILYDAWEMRVPHLSGTSNTYHPSRNPGNRLDVQVLSWDAMKRRLGGGDQGEAAYRRGWNDAVGQIVVPGRK